MFLSFINQSCYFITIQNLSLRYNLTMTVFQSHCYYLFLLALHFCVMCNPWKHWKHVKFYHIFSALFKCLRTSHTSICLSLKDIILELNFFKVLGKLKNNLQKGDNVKLTYFNLQFTTILVKFCNGYTFGIQIKSKYSGIYLKITVWTVLYTVYFQHFEAN